VWCGVVWCGVCVCVCLFVEGCPLDPLVQWLIVSLKVLLATNLFTSRLFG
jgi:hypothetical protein